MNALIRLATAIALAGVVSTASAQSYDIVTKGGRVIDPASELDATRDVGINRDRIEAVSDKPLAGKRIIDAKGLIVSAGFIDLHSHGLELPGQRMQAFDGVTTALELESGILPIAKKYEQKDHEGRSINTGFDASWGWARSIGMIPEMPPVEPRAEWYFEAFKHPRWTTDQTTAEELRKLLATLEQALNEGAIAIGVNAGYVPGVGGKELMAVSELAARRHVLISTH